MLDIGCVILGAILAIIAEAVFSMIRNSWSKRHSAKLLYYDMLSIMKYITLRFLDEKKIMPDIRYNSEWQTMLLKLDYLSADQIVCIYNFYDAVYNYNFTFNQENSEIYYEELKKIILDDKFVKTTEFIKSKAKIKNDKRG